jgi:hypothetical protein
MLKQLTYTPDILPVTPTRALPGTSSKVDVMVNRQLRGECLFHEDDAKMNKDIGMMIVREYNKLLNARTKGTMHRLMGMAEEIVSDRLSLGEADRCQEKSI